MLGVARRRILVRHEFVEILPGLGIFDAAAEPWRPGSSLRGNGPAGDLYVKVGVGRCDRRGKRPGTGSTANDIEFVVPHRLLVPQN
ncbi:hypothetical protein MSMEI_2143 [Mycolicibacterium smegmatis MC2 155]|uniref:Uncharacterized protein n=1 Tax=Mycolicibacterium smegmatis (strain ATCC 700084 / mc(2)155) TaxID=246196 RepID=I7FIJ9_MYCS2|nr:hypothetical protein MSMEI_2143 [Mycolicibacterium smegmatis MC2 155]